MRRRSVLAAGSSAAFAMAGCGRGGARTLEGGWVGVDVERGHHVRDSKSGALPPPALQRRCGVAVVGAGIAGLGAARELVRDGLDDVQVFELEDAAGGNSRAHAMAGRACPLGAHYLPVPGPQAHEVADLLDELGLRRLVAGRAVYDERHLCHSPQERLWFDGAWHEGVLPPHTDAVQLQRFARLVADAQHTLGFAMPTARAPWTPAHDALDAQPFDRWLEAQGLSDPALRWWLDYACLDDFGAPAAAVSAWAGLHYFGSRHGVQAADAADTAARDAVLTWPEGNAWLVRHLAAPLAGRVHAGHIALRIRDERHGASVDLWNVAEQRLERWQAQQVVVALPLHVAAAVVEPADSALVSALRSAAAVVPHAPWLVANLLLDEPLLDRPGLPLAWDNVIFGGRTLGYVNAGHQSLQPVADARLLTVYWALGAEAQRRALLDEPWQAWAQRVIDDLASAHPELPARLRRIDLVRYGHAMAVPAPGVRGHPALRALASSAGRLHLAHADLSGYSVFEEALFHGHDAARRALRSLQKR